MRFTLKDYQTEAVAKVLRNLDRAREDTRRRGDSVAFALSATTGAGKTVMATAVIEALFGGSEDYDFDADPSAVVLWVTDDPNLNEQTRYRIIECGDLLGVSRLKVIGDGGFDQPKLESGNVYFLNTQKLGAATSWVVRNDRRTNTLWDTIQNTIEDESLTLYLILDEAHRGMQGRTGKEANDRATIVQRLINGHNGIPAAPIVWGISATVQRFSEAMKAAQAEGRTTYAAVQVDPRAVQESGLLKDTIILDFPAESGDFETTFMRSALRQMREATALWAEYAKREAMQEPVLPLMVLQAPNKPSERDMGRWVDVVHEVWPEVGDDGVANVFGEHTDLTLGKHTVPYIAPQNVQDATHVRVLLAKDAVSTGWDCPRAEVLLSLRPAKDRTYITQLLGRMVRTPLARRIESDERLNAVSCYLPNFDRSTAVDVAKVLTGEKTDVDDPDSGAATGTGRKVLTSPVGMLWNANVPEDVGNYMANLPSETTPKGTTKPIKRMLGVAAAIAVDGIMEDANEQAHEAIYRKLDGQLAEHAYEVERGVEEIYKADVHRITTRIAERALLETTHGERADERTVDDAFRAATRALGAAVANGYVKRMALANSDGDEFDTYDAKAKVAALLAVDGVIGVMNAEADRLSATWLNEHRATIKGLTEDRQAVYGDLRQQARDPQPTDIVTPKSRIENTRDAENDPLPTRPFHVLADESGEFPVGTLNDWELAVVDTELERHITVAWYRNPSIPAADALQIPYRLGEKWKPMQPDFIFFTRKQDGSLAASIVDPHGDHLADALPKLKGLARFAEKYGDQFLRIEAVSKVDDGLRMLDLTEPRVRQAIEEADSAGALYRGDQAKPYT